jgi:demethylmenaquinone methyltransferase/2-methoxy-6-polyprenyl-1,4-benzoquinol methylase
MFDAIAPRYDRLNRVLSLGADAYWRRRTVRALGLAPGQRVLDVATGTGDLAIEIARSCPGVEVVGIDPSAGMLELGRSKVAAASLLPRVRLEQGDGQDLPLADASFDAACVAFGIRNFPDRARGLREMARVVRPGGRVAVLELSEPRGGILAPFARFYIRALVPWIGSVLSRAPEYRYLQRSIATFPPAEEFAATMERAGLELPRVQPLTFGVVHLYVARVPHGLTTPGAERS